MIERLTIILCGVALMTGCDRNRIRHRQPPQVQEFASTGQVRPALPPAAPAPLPMPVPPPPPDAQPPTPLTTDLPGRAVVPAANLAAVNPSPAGVPPIASSVPNSSASTGPATLPQSIVSPASDPPSTPLATGQDLATLVRSASERFATVVDFEARLVKREVVNGKPMPTEEAIYRFRQRPFSVYMKVTGEQGRGREVLYVQGRDDDGLYVVTGKGDHFLRGFKTRVPLNDPRLTEKSRYKVTEAGFGRTLNGLSKAVGEGRAKIVGPELRPEYPYTLTAVQITVPNGGEPQLPHGGIRMVYLDAKPESPTYLMPVLVVTRVPDGKEVEYYLFDRIRLPAQLSDADFDPSRLGNR